MKNNEQLKFAALYLESAQVKMEFEDSTKNYISRLSPTQLETIKYGYERIDEHPFKLKSATVVLKDLKEISDEHAIETAKIEGYNPTSRVNKRIPIWDKSLYIIDVELSGTSYNSESFIISSNGYIEWDNNEGIDENRTSGVNAGAYDYLRAQGYLLPPRGKTIEEILKLNWAEYEL